MACDENLSGSIFLYEDLQSEESREFAVSEMIRIFRDLTFNEAGPPPITMEDLIRWHNEFLSTDNPRFTKSGRYFGNESYFSKFLYLAEDAYFRRTFYIFKIRGYVSETFFKAETPIPPDLFPWTIVEMENNKESIIEPPYSISGTYREFETADDLIHYIDEFQKKHSSI
ncbi:MAG: hypothetical protein KAH01_01925 [Caldisericia bacterium]|nr:hypothetical protein [Caldisericia bacterium]